MNGRVLGQGPVDEEFHKEYELDAIDVESIDPDDSMRS
jgi:hypothetical protein